MFITTIEYMDLHKIANSGQAFRIHRIDDTHVELVAFGRYLQIAKLQNNQFAFSCDESEFYSIWYSYFDLNRDYINIINSIDSKDKFLTNAAQYGYGIRILNQDYFETLISYIISQRKSIPSIMTSVERLAAHYGHRINIESIELDNIFFVKPLKNEYYSFPNSSDLSNITIKELEQLGVGYRAEYIYDAVHRINSGLINLYKLDEADDDSLYNSLIEIKGVGKKVANCVMLFAYGRTARFPIDVWIQRVVDKYYDGAFNESIYGEANGILQQLMFYAERTQRV